MNRNVSSQDVAVRVLFGSFLLAFASFAGYLSWHTGTFGFSLLTTLFLIGCGLLLTAVFQWCPLNKALGRGTWRNESRFSENHAEQR